MFYDDVGLVAYETYQPNSGGNKLKVAIQKFRLVSGAALLILQQTIVFAQDPSWTITYQPVTTTSVPTLSEWAMLGLSLTLAALAIYSLRNKSFGKPMASVLFAFALALGTTSSNKIVSEANAIVEATHAMTEPSGGTVIPWTIVSDFEEQVINTSGVTQGVTGVSPASSSTVSTPACAVGVIVQPNQSCWVLSPTPSYP